jgi:hypothetical protein
MRREWASLATGSNCGRLTRGASADASIRRVVEPRGQGRYAYKVEISDSCFGERSELGQALPGGSGFPIFKEGDDRWISYQILIPDQYPQPTSSQVSNPWNVTMQLKQIGSANSGSVAAGIYLEQSEWILSMARYSDPTAGYVTDRYNLGPLTRNVWAKFSLHVKFSPDPSVGSMEVWGDLAGTGTMTRIVPQVHHVTMKKDPADLTKTLSSAARIGSYRNPNITGTAVSYYDGFTIATSRSAAESNAFRP